MKYVLKNQEMQDVDKETIQQIGMPGLVLMERASEKIARRLMETVRKSDRILSLAGCGNNGGDALAAARILLEEGYSVDFTVVGDLSKASGDLKAQYDILTRLGYEQKKEIDYNGYDWILEGMFGVGLSREIAVDIPRWVWRQRSPVHRSSRLYAALGLTRRRIRVSSRAATGQ